MIDVKQIAEKEFQITWDPNDPIENMLSTWTEEDFIRAIREGCEQKLQSRAIIPEQS
jgi:hypothetical protein